MDLALIYNFLILGLINPAFGLLAVICMISPVATGFFKGRIWCGRYCPRGSFYDQVLARVGKKKPANSAFA